MALRTYNNKTGKWEVNATSQASQVELMDALGNYEEDSVEGALRELGSKKTEQEDSIKSLKQENSDNKKLIEEIKQTATTAKNTSDQNKKDLTEAIANLKDVSDRFDYHVLHHPGGSGGGTGGGGGTTMPTITSTYSVTSVDADTEVKIPIFFTSPNLGEGTCYVTINDIEVDSVKVKQGNNSISIGILPDLKNVVSLYVKDRANLISNQLEWTIIKGGVELSITFDSDVDYAIDDNIRLLYNVTSASTDPIILNVSIDGNIIENPSMSGYNEYIFKDLAVGVHEVVLQAVSGAYKSNTIKFNLVIVNSDNLYISSTFKGGSLEYGVPLQFPYRISKLSPENFDVKMYIDNEEVKSLSIPSGSYIWTISSLEVGFHKLRIDAAGNTGDTATYEVSVSVNYGDYVPKKPVEAGLIAWFDATERTNNDVDKEIWPDKSGQGVKATLHNFNFYTNGWINNSLVCDSDAYVEIDMKPYQNNVKQGSTIEILYTPHNIGYEDAKILDYTNSEVPYNGIYINIVESQFSSINSKGKVSLDEEDELHLTYVIDRINKFGKIFVNGILSRTFYLSDSGSGVNAFYEDFSHNEKIYLNCEKGTSKFGSCEIKQFRVYNRALDDDEILNNYIADKHDIKEQEKVYKFNYENKTTPEMRFYGDLSNMTNTQRVQFRIKYTSPNEELYGSSFD